MTRFWGSEWRHTEQGIVSSFQCFYLTYYIEFKIYSEVNPITKVSVGTITEKHVCQIQFIFISINLIPVSLYLYSLVLLLSFFPILPACSWEVIKLLMIMWSYERQYDTYWHFPYLYGQSSSCHYETRLPDFPLAEKSESNITVKASAVRKVKEALNFPLHPELIFALQQCKDSVLNPNAKCKKALSPLKPYSSLKTQWSVAFDYVSLWQVLSYISVLKVLCSQLITFEFDLPKNELCPSKKNITADNKITKETLTLFSIFRGVSFAQNKVFSSDLSHKDSASMTFHPCCVIAGCNGSYKGHW